MEDKAPIFSLHTIICFFLALHIAFIVVVLWQVNTKTTVLKRAEKTSVSLGIRTASAGAVAMNEVTPQKAVTPTKQAEPTPKAIKKAEEKPTPIKKPSLKPAPTPKPKPIQKKEKEPIKPIKKPTKEVEQEIVKKSPQQPLQKAQKNGAAGIDGSMDNKIKQQEVGQSTQLAGDPNSLRYDAILRAHLMKSKRYPRALKMKRKEGSVEVTFTINQKGELLDSQIVKRTGDKAFNQAIKRLFKRATPLPVPPKNSPWETREYHLVFNYQLD